MSRRYSTDSCRQNACHFLANELERNKPLHTCTFFPLTEWVIFVDKDRLVFPQRADSQYVVTRVIGDVRHRFQVVQLCVACYLVPCHHQTQTQLQVSGSPVIITHKHSHRFQVVLSSSSHTNSHRFQEVLSSHTHKQSQVSGSLVITNKHSHMFQVVLSSSLHTNTVTDFR